jgi:hypothetical protein
MQLGAKGHAEVVGLESLVRPVVVVELGDFGNGEVVEAHVDSIV